MEGDPLITPGRPGPLRVGRAGVGRFGALHAAVLATFNGIGLAAMADPDTEHRQQVAERCNAPQQHREAKVLIEYERLDALILATRQ